MNRCADARSSVESQGGAGVGVGVCSRHGLAQPQHAEGCCTKRVLRRAASSLLMIAHARCASWCVCVDAAAAPARARAFFFVCTDARRFQSSSRSISIAQQRARRRWAARVAVFSGGRRQPQPQEVAIRPWRKLLREGQAGTLAPPPLSPSTTKPTCQYPEYESSLWTDLGADAWLRPALFVAHSEARKASSQSHLG